MTTLKFIFYLLLYPIEAMYEYIAPSWQRIYKLEHIQENKCTVAMVLGRISELQSRCQGMPEHWQKLEDQKQEIMRGFHL